MELTDSVGTLKTGRQPILAGEFCVVCKSFGFKYGTDNDADIVFDVRCLPNPFYEEALKNETGLNVKVRDFVLSTAQSREFLSKIESFLDTALPLYIGKGRTHLTVSFGCTGGRHRSVTLAEIIGEYIKNSGYNCEIVHRDIKR